MASRRHLFKVRFRENGKVKTLRTTVSSPHDAAKKMKSSGQIVSVTKTRR